MNADDPLYRTTEACALTGATPRQIDYWDRLGIITPTRPAKGSGSQRGYSYTDLVAMRVLVLICGFLGGTAGVVLTRWAATLAAIPDPATGYLMVGATDVTWLPHHLPPANHLDPVLMLIDIDQAARDIGVTT